MPSDGSGRFPRSRTQTYDWRTFLLEFLYGLLTIAGCFLALPEMFILSGLKRLGEHVVPSSDDLRNDGSEYNVLPELASSSDNSQSHPDEVILD